MANDSKYRFGVGATYIHAIATDQDGDLDNSRGGAAGKQSSKGASQWRK